MQRRLEDYVMIFRGVIPEDLRLQTLELLKDENLWVKHRYHNERDNEDITYDDDLETSNYGIANHEEMMSLIYSCIGNYLRQIDLPWFNSWVGFSPVRYNRYKSNTNMKLHCDHINTVFDGTIRGIPTLTILGLLNDEFKGGEFTLFDQEEDVIPLEKGDVIMFPSNFQYPHKVNSVTNGVRYSFVSWAY